MQGLNTLLTGLRESLPGVYYYTTRYAHPYERVLHVVKYWLTFALVLAVLAGGVQPQCWLAAVVAWVLFLNVYDVYCLENDQLAAKREADPTVRVWKHPVPAAAFHTIKGLLAGMLFAVFGFLAGGWALAGLIAALSGTAVCFALHNRLDGLWRVATHYALYVSKGLVLLPAFWSMLAADDVRGYLLLVALFNLAYTPRYVARKLPGWRTPGAAHPDRPFARWWLAPLLYKNLIVGALAIGDLRFLAVLGWVDAWTLLELVFRTRVSSGHASVSNVDSGMDA